MKAKYQSKIAKSVHTTAKGLERIGAINTEKMRTFDKECLAEIKGGGHSGLSQSARRSVSNKKHP